MGEQQPSDTMNLDLNLGPIPEQGSGSIPIEPVNLVDLIEDPFSPIRARTRQRGRWRQMHVPHDNQNIPVELNQLMVNSGNAITLQAGEGSVAAEERTTEVPKTCENNGGFLEDSSEKKENDEKGSGNDGSFFDCNICFDLATEPIVTCCGHLFCWPCLYRWLHVSDAKECPVCKGEVTMKNVTPIYGRGNNHREVEEDLTIKIPQRPHARRIESWRQTIQRSALNFPVEEMLRRLSNRFDATRDSVPPSYAEGAREEAERTNSLLTRLLVARGLRREQNPVQPQEDVVYLTQGERRAIDIADIRRLRDLMLRRWQEHRSERTVEPYIRNHPNRRSQEPAPPVDDRDSFSSIAAVINSESQTMDTAVEIDSMVSHSTSSSRRRNDNSRASDMDSGDSPAPRRRRLN